MKNLLLVFVPLLVLSCSSLTPRAKRSLSSGTQKFSCQSLVASFMEVELGISRESLKISEKVVARQSSILEATMKNRGISGNNIYIGQNSKLYSLGESLDIKFPGDSHYTEVRLFGFPEKVNGRFYINVKLWSYKGEYFGRDNNVLERMSLSDFWKLMPESYKTYNVKENGHILLPSKVKGESGRRVLEAHKVVLKLKNTAKVIAQDGSARYISYKEIFMHNFSIPSSDMAMISEFFNNGGRGTIIQLDHKSPATMKYTGSYIKVRKLPKIDPESPYAHLFLFEESYDHAQALLDDKIPLYLTTQYHGIRGSVSPKDSRGTKFVGNRIKGAREDRMIISAVAEGSTFVHERVHYQDELKQRVISFREWAQEKYKKHELAIPFGALTKVNTFIKEQRAYSKELDYLKELGSRAGMYSDDLSYTQYAEAKITKSKEIFIKVYFRPVSKILDLLEEGSPFKRELLQKLEELSFESEYISLKELLGN